MEGFPPALLDAVFGRKIRMSRDAAKLVEYYLKIWVEEAIHRAVAEAQADGEDEVGIRQLEKIVAQMIMDF
jgi:hypothetical protein